MSGTYEPGGPLAPSEAMVPAPSDEAVEAAREVLAINARHGRRARDLMPLILATVYAIDAPRIRAATLREVDDVIRLASEDLADAIVRRLADG